MIDDARRIDGMQSASGSGRPRRAVALVLIVALLAALTLAPRRAEALSDGEIAGIVIGSIAGYVVLIMIGTVAVYGWKRKKPAEPLPIELIQPRPAATDGFRLASQCAPRDGQMPLFCW